MISVHSCPICNSSLFTPHTSCIDYTVSHETFNVISCKNCDFTLTSPRPANEELGKYYQSENYISHSNKAATVLDQIYLIARNFTLKWKVSLLRKYYPSKSDLRILDYGCGTGEFLKACQDSGFKISGV